MLAKVAIPISSPTNAAFAAAREAWPEIDADEKRFRTFVAERQVEPAASSELNLVDLYIVFACLDEVPRALAAFEERYFEVVRRETRRFRLTSSAAEDATQLVRSKLFVRDGATPPGLASYRGTGSVRAWLRVITVRILIDLCRRREVDPVFSATDRILERFALESMSTDLSLVKRRHEAAIRAALETAMRDLGQSETALLQVVVGGSSIEQAAQQLGMSRRTAYRLFDRMRVTLFSTFKANLQRTLRVPMNELDSLVRDLRSQIVEQCAVGIRKNAGPIYKPGHAATAHAK